MYPKIPKTICKDKIIEVKTNITKIKSASLEMYQEIYKDEELLFTAKIKLAYLKDLKPAKIPQNLLDFFTNV